MDKSVGVVGAGIAGLRTAQLLVERGVEVSVFEARPRIGGRLETVEIEGRGTYEAGGEWIDADHHRVIALVEESGLSMETPNYWPGIVVRKGDACTEDEPWDDASADLDEFYREAAHLCAEVPDQPWQPSPVLHLDEVSLGSWVGGLCRSPRGRWFVEAILRSDEGDDPDQVGLLSWLSFYRKYLGREDGDMSTYRIRGGGGALCDAVAERIVDRIKTKCVVGRVVPADSGIDIFSLDRLEGRFDHVVMALPPPLLAGIDITGLPLSHSRAWGHMGMARAVKVSLVFSEAFWRSSDWSGRLLCDLPCQQVWDAGTGDLACLNCYICGEAAEALMDRNEPVQVILRAVSEIFPGALDHFEEGFVHDWTGDEFAKGAFPLTGPGSAKACLPYLSERVGNVHFAGDATSEWVGFIEGALESAERVVKEICG